MNFLGRHFLMTPLIKGYFLLPFFFIVFLFSTSAEPANLIVVGDTRLQPECP